MRVCLSTWVIMSVQSVLSYFEIMVISVSYLGIYFLDWFQVVTRKWKIWSSVTTTTNMIMNSQQLKIMCQSAPVTSVFLRIGEKSALQDSERVMRLSVYEITFRVISPFRYVSKGISPHYGPLMTSEPHSSKCSCLKYLGRYPKYLIPISFFFSLQVAPREHHLLLQNI